MFSLLQYFSSKLFNYNYNNNENLSNKDEKENLENILAQIDDIKENFNKQEEPQLNLINDEEGCFYKSGTISFINNDYVLIENKYMCELKHVQPTDLKIGDKVYYMAYKTDKDESLKIRKIVGKFDTLWDTEENEIADDVNRQNSNLEIKENNSDIILEKRQINKRSIIGKVNKRKGRQIFLENGTCVHLDNVSSEFIPFVGDWVKLDSLVEVDENIPNFQGEILEVQSISPLRELKKIGKVTEYNNESESGIIEKTIIFTKAVCMAGYIPCIGDKVVVQCIESDQGVQQNWRALTVVPLEDVHNNFQTSSIQFKPQLPIEEINELIKDKENIEITNNINVNLDAKEEKEIKIVIKNNGKTKQVIQKCSFLSKKSESQLTLLLPKKNEAQTLESLDEITYTFKCKARFVGVSEELVIFKFKQFKIGRIFQIIVNSINPRKQISKENINIHDNNDSNQLLIIPPTYEDGMYISGVKPYKPAKFIPVRPVVWKIPNILWTTINKIIMEKKTRSESEFAVAEKIPCLQQHLTFENYKKRFDYLLYLEEIAQILDMQRFNMSSATLHRNREYLTLNVPGLAEKRPSLIIGDKIIVSFKWDESKGQKKYEGYIHKIKSTDVFLKFNPTFHEKYCGEDCQVSFKGSTTVLQRCHTAIGVVVNRLGSDFLFPKKVIEKEAQYNFIDNEQNNENELLSTASMNDIDTNEQKLNKLKALLLTRKINWFNNKLNIYQKEAVKNVLKGLARPLPYVIFGPPGTGKTITVCEAILQILFTMSESRILIATPSNSSANLIAERLLDNNLLKPGDLVRLVAHHYIESECIPDKLIPYCATADIASEGSRSFVNISDSRGYTLNVTLNVLCRHRIIIGTCSALGILYNMGCKPGHFTHIVIDEAGQANEPEIMIPLSLAHFSTTQVILAGDPKQLGPINQSRLAGYFGLNDSFLVRLLQQFPYQRDPEGFASGYDPRLITKLLINYRSLPDLLDLPNKLFYEAELIPHIDPDNSEEAELLESLSDMLPKRLGAPPAIIFHGVNGKNMQDPDSPSWYNPEEATQVYIYLLDLYNHGLQPEDIGIITPYSKQVYRIRNLLAELEVEIPKVGSVEEFQGQERKVIILSTVRTSEDKVKEDVRHALGFVAARERLNVAITRARTLLIIIGNPKLLQQDVYWRSVLEYCNSRSSIIGHGLS